MTTTGSEKRRRARRLALVCLAMLVAAGLPARGAGAGSAPDAEVSGHGRMMALSIRIAQAEGNESRIRKYKSLARQRRAGGSARATFQSSRKTRFAPW